MARKGLLASITGPDAGTVHSESRTDYIKRGASRAMMKSLDDMAESAKLAMDGDAVVSLNPALVDDSFVADRIEDTEEEFSDLLESIKNHGQSTPILVRPHPKSEGRYMIVFGHRRLRVARELGRDVRAVIKSIEDIAHIIAQGQENTARANLSFVEKAVFAKRLGEMGQTKETIKSALSIDDTLLSRMLSVAETVPSQVIEAIGAAKKVGRDRWEELKKLSAHPSASKLALERIATDEFLSHDSNGRFQDILTTLKAEGKKARKSKKAKPQKHSWASSDDHVSATYTNSGKAFDLSLRSKDASNFGAYIATNLEQIYNDYLNAKEEK